MSELRTAFLDHVTISVADLEVSRRFYQRALAPWAAQALELPTGEVSFGPPGSEDLAIVADGQTQPALHIAFAASDRETVDRFHAAALAAGGRENGAPGLRPHYHAGYYAAYVLDPDGNNVEAVFHDR